MMRSLFAGVSGLKNHQTRMDVIGDNIANVNTVGFKKSRVTFQDMLSQTLRGGSSPTANRAGTNPLQVGLGMTLASIDVIHTGGSPQSTGKNTDLSIEGEGFFLVGEGTNIYYTRAGNFDFDYNKTFYNVSNGMVVKGILADSNGVIDPEGSIVDINLASQVSSPPQASSSVEYTKNLDARAVVRAGSVVGVVALPGPTNVPIGAADTTRFGVVIPGLNPTDYSYNRATGNVEINAGVAAGNYDIYYNVPTGSASGAHVAGTDTVITLNTTQLPIGEVEIVDADDDILDSDSYTVDYATGTVTIDSGAPSETYTVHYLSDTHKSSPMTVYDSLGGTHTLTVNYEKIDENLWYVRSKLDNQPIMTGGTGLISFDTEGKYVSSTVTNAQQAITGRDPLNISLDFTKLTQNVADYTTLAFNQNGYAAGDLQGVSVDTTGTITGSFSNGQSRKLAQLAIATFANPSGLVKVGNNLFQVSNNSGEADTGIPGISGRGTIKPESLEMSNVDLSQEFVDMIITQRGFQANSRVITTSDQILEELVNLRR